MLRVAPRSFAYAASALVLLGGIGTLDLAQPLGGDQSLFLLGAQQIHGGSVLYRDFWDLKQPGIFVFYFLSGLIGGFTPFAVHAFELLCFLGFSLAVMTALRRFGTSVPNAALGALAATVPYFVFASYYEELQVEALIGIPLFLALWFAAEGAREARSRRRILWLAGAGVACAVVLAFKLIFGPLLAVVVAAALGLRRRSVADAAFVVGMTALATLPELVYFAVHGALAAALATWFTIPPAILASIPAQDPHALLDGLALVARRFAPLVVFALVGAVIAIRRGVTPLERATCAWLVAGPAIVLAQRTSWWEYQWLLLIVPLGIFAATGIAATLRAVRSSALARPWRLAAGVLAAVFLVSMPLRDIGARAFTLASFGFATSPNQREAFRGDQSRAYGAARADRNLVPRAGSLYVMGDPAFYLVVHRQQPIVLNGWSLELLLPAQLVELERELRARPPTFIYRTFDDSGPQTMLERTPSLAAYLTSAYALKSTGRFGRLYAYHGAATAVASRRGHPSRR